tara:strand:+ start:498 stop:662 length:165 start_codon:yes stop_codon:yes gene_type:complete
MKRIKNILKKFSFTFKVKGFTINRVVKAVDYVNAVSAIRSEYPKVVVQKIKEVA